MLNNEFMSRQLNIPIELCVFFKDVFELYEIRAKVYESNGIKYEVRTKEQGHNRAHMHASYGKFEISISIDDSIEILEGNLPHKQQKIALKFVREHIDLFRTKWNSYFVDCILPLTASRIK